MASKLTKDDVLRVAELARLELSPDDVEAFARQLADILGYAQQIQDVDTAGVEPTSHPVEIAPAWRGDIAGGSLPIAASLANAPSADAEAGLFKVPKVL